MWPKPIFLVAQLLLSSANPNVLIGDTVREKSFAQVVQPLSDARDLNIDWQVAPDSTWAQNCDFDGKDFSNAKVPAEQCGPTCRDNPQCTHFTWTDFEDGTCWMKSGKANKEQAFVIEDGQSSVCGVLNDDVLSAKVNWQTAPDSDWANGCDFESGDLESQQAPAEKCGLVCASTPECTHFAWTDDNDGTCWMKSGEVSKSDAFPNGNPATVCGIRNHASGIEWQKAPDSLWSFGCDFEGDDLWSVMVPGEECGPSCAAVPGCSKFAWTPSEGGTCYLKTGSAMTTDAVPNGNPDTVCGFVIFTD